MERIEDTKATKSNGKRVLIGQLLINDSILTSEQLNQALEYKGKNNMMLGQALQELNMVNEEAVFVVNFLHDGPATETNRNVRHQGISPAEYMGTYRGK